MVKKTCDKVIKCCSMFLQQQDTLALKHMNPSGPNRVME